MARRHNPDLRCLGLWKRNPQINLKSEDAMADLYFGIVIAGVNALIVLEAALAFVVI
jgi:hypothetical protein